MFIPGLLPTERSFGIPPANSGPAIIGAPPPLLPAAGGDLPPLPLLPEALFTAKIKYQRSFKEIMMVGGYLQELNGHL